MVKTALSKFLRKMTKFENYYCVSMPGIIHLPTFNEKENNVILWLHNLPIEIDPRFAKHLADPKLVKSIKYLVVVSEYHKQEVLNSTLVPEDKIVVINNAINPIQFNKNKFNNVDTVKIIHTSSPERGMEYLLAALPYIEEDFQLDIFNGFDPEMVNIPDDFRGLLEDKRITFYGRTPKQTVMKYLSEAHIHAYPSIHTETSCLSQIEALAAGCLTVHSNSGAIPESSLGYGLEFNIDPYRDDILAGGKEYAKLLSNAIQEVKAGRFDPGDQPAKVYERFSWEEAEKAWKEFHDRL